MRSIAVRYIVRGESSSVDVLGIDISKADFHRCLLQGNKQAKNSFPNAPAGFRRLRTWLRNRGCTKVHVCMEATGAYWEGLACALHQAGLEVSVVNPARTVHFARSQLRRTKTDRVDAEMIAEFCKTQKPDRWSPPSRVRSLKCAVLLSFRAQLVDDKSRLIADRSARFTSAKSCSGCTPNKSKRWMLRLLLSKSSCDRWLRPIQVLRSANARS